MRALVSAGFQVDLRRHFTASREVLASTPPAMIVLDPLVAGGRAEIEEFERLSGGPGRLAVLLVVDEDDASGAVELARTHGDGAFDLIHRHASPDEYALRIERLLRESEQWHEVRELRHRATHDDRTNLLRPKAFQQRLAEHFSAAERHRFDLALLLVDLDDFGRVNKLFDHTVGDELIHRVGHVIHANLRTEDAAGRIGGDEFAVVLPYTRGVEAAHVVRRLGDQIVELTETALPGQRGVHISASIGFETFDGADLDSVETMRAHAEVALREAKHRGGNRGIYYRSMSSPSRPPDAT